jgi:hypothetical protein
MLIGNYFLMIDTVLLFQHKGKKDIYRTFTYWTAFSRAAVIRMFQQTA